MKIEMPYQRFIKIAVKNHNDDFEVVIVNVDKIIMKRTLHMLSMDEILELSEESMSRLEMII